MMPSAGIRVQLAAVVVAAATIQSTLSYDVIAGDITNTQHYYDGSGAIDSGNHKHQQQPEVAVAITDTSQSQASPSSSWDHSSNNIELLLQKSTSNYSPNIILSSYFPTVEVHSQFTRWKKRHGKNYSTRQEHAHRKWIWLLNHEYIERHNKSTNNTIGENNILSDGGDTSRKSGYYALAHNDFSDLTLDEFQQRFSLGKYRGMRKGIRKSDERSNDSVSIFTTSSSRLQELRRVEEEDEAIMVTRNGLDFVDNVKISSDDSKDGYESTALNNDVMDYKNWVEEGAVTNVKNQLICGACWAFSAVGAIEGARYIKTGNLTDLSMQQLIDCDFSDFGCNGGLMDQAFQYDLDTNVGLCSLQDYPFAYHRHWFNGCRRYMPYCTPLRDSRVEKFVDVNKTEEDLKAAIATQPISVAVSAGLRDWQFYSKGIFGKGCSEDIDHAVLAVGYGHYDPQSDPDATIDSVESDYWLLKNSWGERWGMNGYIQLARGTGNEAEGGSSCILTMASRPILKVEN